MAGFPDDNRITAAIARTELLRAVARRDAAVANARSVLGRVNFVAITARVLDAAVAIRPLELRTLDAIHLAAAMSVPDLRAIVSYDGRMADAAAEAGMVVASPGQSR